MRPIKKLGKVYLVGCGTGDVELLTSKAYKIIQSGDPYVFGRGSEEALSMVAAGISSALAGSLLTALVDMRQICL